VAQSNLTRLKIFRIATATNAAAPVDGTTQPTITLSPLAPTGLATTGILMGLKAPTTSPATPVAAGFSVVPWIRNPMTGDWFAGDTVSMPYGAAFSSFDFDACDLYFQFLAAGTAADGNVEIHISEQ
jgi:hypothetical protein